MAEWISSTASVAGINGGFFGRETPGGEKQLLGLLVQNGRSLSAAPPTRSRSSATLFTRSSFGVGENGMPSIRWASAAAPGDLPRQHTDPELRAGTGSAWPVRAALGCGPRLIHRGRLLVAARQERLASPGALPRTFVGYSFEGDRPRHLALATATAMEFDSCASVLERYFAREHGTRCEEAMALDGGGSSQLAYRLGDQIVEAQPSSTTVPTAILVRDARTAGR